jgi:hypothetical protein
MHTASCRWEPEVCVQVLRTVLRWVLPTIAGLLFVVVGAMKFVDRSWVTNFTRWGYPSYF